MGAEQGNVKPAGYKSTELHKVVSERLMEGGEFDCSATGREFKDENYQLSHSKAGLLSMVGTSNASGARNASRFQLLLRPAPELDRKHVVFGQVVGQSSSERLHVLHWIEAVGTRSGAPRE